MKPCRQERDNLKRRRMQRRDRRREFLTNARILKGHAPEMWESMTTKERLEACRNETERSLCRQVGRDTGLPFRTVAEPVEQSLVLADPVDEHLQRQPDSRGRKVIVSSVQCYSRKRFGYYEEKSQLANASKNAKAA